MSLRGERFVVDFSDDGHESTGARTVLLKPGNGKPSSASLVGDIVEREPGSTKPPSAPTLKASATGFPEHKKRSKVSTFKQQRVSAPTSISRSLTPNDGGFGEIERREIDRENKQRLAAMSVEEIEQERSELLANLSPSFIENLLKRANLDKGKGDTGIDPESEDTQNDSVSESSPTAGVSVPEATAIPEPAGRRLTAARTVQFDDDVEPADPGILQPASNFSRQAAMLTDPAFHFPAAPSAPDLDPSDPAFLEALHEKYFPSLPADPLKLAWMAPVPTHGSLADRDSPYYPGQSAMPASALRFDFRGALLPPRIARAMPTSIGLHHHGDAPEAAGYTVPELARLARSAFPAQRCIAFQTLGRFLYRLGKGEWGDEGSEMAMGLWRCVDEGKVIETLEEAAAAEGGHQGSKVYAIEATWLWQKGGGKRWRAS